MIDYLVKRQGKNVISGLTETEQVKAKSGDNGTYDWMVDQFADLFRTLTLILTDM